MGGHDKPPSFEINMKTPLTYYGGKARMIATILPLIPPHRCYVEPFIGGGSVFFAKPLAKSNCINDKSGILVNFYHSLKNDRMELIKMIDATPYARSEFDKAQKLLKEPSGQDQIELAWAYFICSKMGFAGMTDCAWGYNMTHGANVKAFANAKERLFEAAAKLDRVYIENRDAVEVINRFDSENTFIYCDPPYINTDQGYYSGYTLDDMELLLKCLQNIKGQFMLSHYKTDWLDDWALANGCRVDYKETITTAANSAKTDKARDPRVECLVMNYNKQLF